MRILQKSKKVLRSERGWATLEYIVGAIVLVGVVTTVIAAFGEPLKEKVTTLVGSIGGSGESGK